MNAKQRKQADKLRRDIEFTMPLKVQKLHADQEQLKKDRADFEEWLEEAKKEVGALQLKAEQSLKAKTAESMKALQETRDEITAREKMGYDQEKKLREAAKGLEARMHELENGKILGDVLLQLELDADPAEIATALRVRFGLLIPEW